MLKPGKPLEDPASYRPVSLTEVWIRHYERVLKKHNIRHLEEIDFISQFLSRSSPVKTSSYSGFKKVASAGYNEFLYCEIILVK